MVFQITHSSKRLCSNSLHNLAPDTSLKASLQVTNTNAGHMALPVRPTHGAHPYLTCVLDPPLPRPGMCFSRHPSGSLPNSLQVSSYQGRSSLTTQSLHCSIFLHNIDHRLKHFVYRFAVDTHRHRHARAHTHEWKLTNRDWLAYFLHCCIPSIYNQCPPSCKPTNIS